ncbi:unnamed protein product (macronuclear) [Paramecium tetraurelia]|uniref:Uncharacterized protein n=1 Tax=Paramecium tetraurelia TaxID=5888 RepID=A0BY92_PARTE|nr:uncharacterized protein GSPATT00033362001 [Paramecium tetraurelia]CAK63509.1 unnamed protein product [Paramecium tetraurelia]|eukprot:XP_001430907.1 hypothetical protein (macronuclear) [Paramecium tetraurelia strain d4-2]
MKKVTQTTASTFQPKRSLAKAKSQNQFEETDPAQRDRKIIRMRNVVDLGDAQEDNKKNQRKNEDQIDPLLEQLDQWHENIMSKKKTYAFEQVKQNDNHNKLIENEFTLEHGPQINSNIINQIMKPIEIPNFKTEENNEDVQVQFQMLRANKESGNVLKTLDQVRIEMNKQILNTLLLQKVTKRLDEMHINRKHKTNWNIQRMDEEITQVFRDQTHTLKQRTLNNFKGLTEYFSNPAQYIDYDMVLSKAKYHSNRPPTSFPTTQIPQQQQNSTSAKSLMESYQLFQTQIKEHKNVLFQMRIENNTLVQQMNHFEEEVQDIRRKFFAKEEKARQGWIPEQQIDGLPNKKRNLMDIIEKIRNQRDQEVKTRTKEIMSLRKQMQQNNEKQQQIQKELDEMRQKKRRCKMLLKDIFLKQFQDSNNSLVPEGLVSIIKNMRKINESAKPEYFPKFLDEISKNYLLLAAQLEIDIEETRILSQKYNHQQLLQRATSARQHISTQRQQMNVSEIKNQVKIMLKKSKVSIKKPVFVQGIDPINPTQFAHVIKWEHQDLEHQQITEPIESNFKNQNVSSERNHIMKDYNQKLVQLQQQLELITNEECQRILKSYSNKKLLSDIQELKMVMYALFGQTLGDQQWIQFVVDWTEQKQLNPLFVLKQEEQTKQSDTRKDQHSIPDKMKAKVSQTLKKLTEVTNVDYNFELIY